MLTHWPLLSQLIVFIWISSRIQRKIHWNTRQSRPWPMLTYVRGHEGKRCLIQACNEQHGRHSSFFLIKIRNKYFLWKTIPFTNKNMPIYKLCWLHGKTILYNLSWLIRIVFLSTLRHVPIKENNKNFFFAVLLYIIFTFYIREEREGTTNGRRVYLTSKVSISALPSLFIVNKCNYFLFLSRFENVLIRVEKTIKRQ